jgi:DNA-binding GntR family transcriptional regulator
MNPTAAKPQRRALGEWAVGSLYDRIFTGELPVGADLAEETLCQTLDVSRATVSFALRQLEQDGMITVAAGNGKRQVRGFSREDLADLYDVRLALEGFAAERAAPRITGAALGELKALQDEMDALSRRPDRPSTRDFGADFAFHRVIALASGSKRALAALQPIWNQTHALLRHLYSIGAYADRQEDAASYDDHRAIIAALAAGDPGLARECMIRHLTRRRDALIRSVTERGGLG